MSMYKFQIEVNNLQTVRARITNSDDNRFLLTPKGKLGFAERKKQIVYLTQKARVSPNNAEAIKPEEIKILGGLLFDMLFEGEVRAEFWKYYDGVWEENRKKAGSAVLSIELIFDEDAEGVPLLSSLPWEFLHANDLQKNDLWLVYAPYIRFARLRQLGHPLNSVRLYPGKALRIALAVTEFDPKILKKNNLGQIEADSVRSKLRQLAEDSAGKIEFVDLNEKIGPKQAINLRTLDSLLREHQPHIFHFIGHGRFNEEGKTSHGEVALVDPFGYPDWTHEVNFCEIFGHYQPPVVILQSCQGGVKSSIYPESGISSSILKKEVLLVVAMQYEISNNTANTFTEEFYEYFAKNKRVKDAVQEGRRKIPMDLLAYGTREFATPMLFLNRCEQEDPFYVDPELESLWQTLVTAQFSDEKVIRLLDNLVVDLGRMNGIGLPVSRDLSDWIASLCSVREQRWNTGLNLWDYSLGEQNFLHPLQWLIEHIAAQVPKEVSSELQKWDDKNQERFRTTPIALRNLRQHLENTEGRLLESSSLLLITIRLADTIEQKYFIHADYYRSNVWRPLGNPNTSVPKENLSVHLATFLDQLEDLKKNYDQTSIGFLVEEELLSFPFEHVKIGLKGDNLGKIFPIFIKAYGRDKVPHDAYMHVWLKKWKLTKESSRKKACDVMKEFDKTLLTSIKNLENFSESIFPILRCAPSQDFAGLGEDWTNILYEHGTSTALWLRTVNENEVNMQNFTERIQSLLSDYLDYVPEALKKMRKISSRFTDDVGNHLVLLWDDPEQMPPGDKQASNEI